MRRDHPRLAFAQFSVDTQTHELFRGGRKIKLQRKRVRVLEMLLAAPNVTVTRKEIIDHLWPNSEVDAEDNLNGAINDIRQALGDSATNPRYISTVHGIGYQFIGSLAAGTPRNVEPDPP